ncbi:MAG: DUF1330 domain-containing protein [Saprospiraceae bacterium]
MKNTYLDFNQDQFIAFSKLPVDTPLQMLNLLRFRKDLTETGLTGVQQYDLYMKAALPFFKASGAKVLFYGSAQMTLIGPTDQLEWDKVLIVAYATKDSFLQMITHKDYPAALRRQALTDSRLIFCTTPKK